MAPRVLIVEDERDVATLLAFNMRAEGFDVVAVESASDAFQKLAAQKFDLVILDLMLPDASGLDVCRRLRADPRTRTLPILIASARAEEVDRIVGLELGADDYVVKPYSVREVVLRARNVLKRGEPASPPAPGDVVEFGVLQIDRAAHRVFVEKNEVALTALEFRLLTTLLERKNRTQPRETLLLDVWQLNTPIETRTVDTHIKRLREKLGAAAGYIRTVRGIGYRFASSPDEPGGDG
jgi:two-component system, OmpR family, phosphate regulon response regulator PhoB